MRMIRVAPFLNRENSATAGSEGCLVRTSGHAGGRLIRRRESYGQTYRYSSRKLLPKTSDERTSSSASPL